MAPVAPAIARPGPRPAAPGVKGELPAHATSRCLSRVQDGTRTNGPGSGAGRLPGSRCRLGERKRMNQERTDLNQERTDEARMDQERRVREPGNRGERGAAHDGPAGGVPREQVRPGAEPAGDQEASRADGEPPRGAEQQAGTPATGGAPPGFDENPELVAELEDLAGAQARAMGIRPEVEFEIPGLHVTAEIGGDEPGPAAGGVPEPARPGTRAARQPQEDGSGRLPGRPGRGGSPRSGGLSPGRPGRNGPSGRPGGRS